MKIISDPLRLKDYIETCNLQSYLDHDLLSISNVHTFEKDEDLIHLDTPSNYLYFLVEGTVRIYSSDTQQIVINRSEPVSLIGEASSLWDLAPKSNVIAETTCVCVGINLKKYRSLLQQDISFLQNVCQILSYRLNSSITLANSLTEPVETRLAKFILENASNQLFSFKLTSCSVILNVSYRHLLRTINNFKEDGLLEKQKNHLFIKNETRLREIAENRSSINKKDSIV